MTQQQIGFQRQPRLDVQHQHEWWGQGWINGPNGITIPALCPCGAVRRFLVPDEPTTINEDGSERHGW